eukprot:gnl/TRDRNA2_/TRDRNA2_176838_c0_seq5.p1 gnl/TRDRNA2_/TRDRNA2_176838_c0~~gnl/TRDRNA2_/TRDRNA2_176838_c0_seq5.p1  ORF type:complete len:129 (+),score=6.75 gnl/TRDRNA2_/TRDRNA2_176838_c0_seq5:101-487(+)
MRKQSRAQVQIGSVPSRQKGSKSPDSKTVCQGIAVSEECAPRLWDTDPRDSRKMSQGKMKFRVEPIQCNTIDCTRFTVVARPSICASGDGQWTEHQTPFSDHATKFHAVGNEEPGKIERVEVHEAAHR